MLPDIDNSRLILRSDIIHSSPSINSDQTRRFGFVPLLICN